MNKFKFEYRITFIYLLIGSLWILFSDRILGNTTNDIQLLTKIQTYKGWFYVVVTGFIFFLFLKKHLHHLRITEKELEKHKSNLEQMIEIKTRELDESVEELRTINDELSLKNNIINEQNDELKKTLENLKNAQTQLLQAEKIASIGILTSGIAHEINNPLNYIMGGLTGLEQYFQDINMKDNRVKLLMEYMRTGLEKSAAIITELDQLNKHDTEDQVICDIHEVIDKSLLLMEDKIKANIQLIKDYAPDKVMVNGSISKLQQIMVNILMNSLQAMENGGVLRISTKKSDVWAKITVADNGTGIADENLARVTDPFFTTKDPGKGTGLGLSIAFALLQEHHGKLNIKSAKGKGTEIMIQIPLIVETNE